MASQIVMPQMGYDMKEGRVVRWLKREGDSIARGESVAEIETDKATVEMEAYASGILGKILVPEGTTVPVGYVIGYILAPGETLAPELLETAMAVSATQVPVAPGTASTAEALETKGEPVAGAEEQVRASPLARRLAKERGIDITRVKGSGPGGRITERDVLALGEQVGQVPQVVTPAAPEGPSSKPVQASTVVELSRMRQAIARITARAKQEIPHFYVTVDVDMTLAMDFRRDLNKSLEARGVHVSVNDLLVKACALALAKYPVFNSSFRDGKLELHPRINIGIAIALEDEGLIVPAVLDCGSRSLAELAKATKDLVERAQQRRLKESEYTDATFSISNMGMFDIESFVAIIHPPQSAVLAVGSVRKEAVVKGDQTAIAQMMKATLSTDHRVADGAQAARFSVEVKNFLEHPVSLLV